MWGKLRTSPVNRFLFTTVCLWILTNPFHAEAQYRGYTGIADVTAFREGFTRNASVINSISCDFTQEKILAALSEKIVSSGDFKFEREDKIRIEYHVPYHYLLIMNGDKIFVQEDGKENEVNVRSNKVFRQIQQIILDCVRGTILNSEGFSSKIFEDKGHYLLEMTPVMKNLSKFYSSIVLIVDKKDYTLQSLEMNEPSGDKTLMIFKNKIINAPLPNEVFDF
jgi:outer membrane lipoprotein-sorting protein